MDLPRFSSSIDLADALHQSAFKVIERCYGLSKIGGGEHPSLAMSQIDRVVKKAFRPLSSPEAQADRSTDGSVSSDRSMLMRDVIAAWLEERALCPRGRKNLDRMITLWLESLDGKQISEIHPRDIARLRIALERRGLSAVTRNDHRKRLRSIFRWAAENGQISRSPITRSSWPTATGPRARTVRALSRSEEDAILGHLSPPLAAFVILTISTGGLRVSEAKRCRRGWLQSGILHVPGWARKQAVDHDFILPSRAIDVLDRLKTGGPDDPLIPGLPGPRRILNALARASERAGLAWHVTPTNLRQTWVDRMRSAHVSPLQMRHLAGWASIGVMDSHYNPPIPEDQARELQERAASTEDPEKIS